MAARAPPCATYRLQFSRDFTFRDAERLVPYLHALGVSHVYASPYLKARTGSAHGYDITDYNALNPELGSDADFGAMVAALHRHDMGQILDIVPNHMGVGRADNAWWLDVVEWGRTSPYADYFDIGWNAAKPDLRGKVLLPFLGDHYGAILEAGELVPAFDEREGSFSVWYHEHRFPLAPHTYAMVLAPAGGNHRALAVLAGAFRTLRPSPATRRARAAMRSRAGELKVEFARLAATDRGASAAVERAVQALRGVKGDAGSLIPLHRLLERQHYRLAYWRVAADEINYRRFFDINELAGVRMEKAEVFETAHRLVLQLLAGGQIDGLRIDHVDGLFDPLQYCERLQARMARPPEAGARPYLVVEKVLAQHESLRREWPVSGTTGYDALNLINGLFVDGRAERAIGRAYSRFIGQHLDFDTVVYECKKQVMDTILAGELEILAIELDHISEANWRTRDFTLAGLRAAIREVAACFPVYRTYVAGRGPSGEDQRDIDWAVAQARKRSESREKTIFDFVHGALTTGIVRRRRRSFNRPAVVRFAMKFQQFTGPVTAKALEDTAFYRYARLLSLNEVGGDPRRFGTTVAAFHHLNQERTKLWPQTMVSTATHDTKRGEDARARINVLTEFPAEWSRRLRRWSTLNRRARVEVEGAPAPSPADEYLLYQTLVGAWPMEFVGADEPAALPLEQFSARIDAYMIKAVREAKLRSNWATPNVDYEAAISAFLHRILDPERSRTFIADLQAFATRVALPGMVNALAQATLKLTIPGVPDIYQGCEFWDLNLVDPDNRRPVDFAGRAAALASLPKVAADAGNTAAPTLSALLQQWTDGRIKLHVLSALLAERRRRPALFRDGAYSPLGVIGDQAEHIVAFLRKNDEAAIAVMVPRLVTGLGAGDGRLPIGEAWTDNAVGCSPALAERRWISVLTGEPAPLHDAAGHRVWRAREIFATLPIAALITSGP
jgi:(1->4)-alpha-D-glucan 1-alpha-D-glucosylmutase